MVSVGGGRDAGLFGSIGRQQGQDLADSVPTGQSSSPVRVSQGRHGLGQPAGHGLLAQHGHLVGVRAQLEGVLLVEPPPQRHAQVPYSLGLLEGAGEAATGTAAVAGLHGVRDLLAGLSGVSVQAV